MKAARQASLGHLNTLGVEARAGLLLTLEQEEDLLALPPFNPRRDLVLGGGSNLLLTGDVPGTVILNAIRGLATVRDEGDSALIEAGAGENWHDLVRWSLDQGLCGLENLSLIPGRAGAAPIQNIGAYGVELADVLEGVTAWDLQAGQWRSFAAEDCGLAYRDSRFKGADKDRFLITSICLRLHRDFRPRIDYAGLGDELAAAGISAPTARDVSEAVIRLRRRKLPDPSEMPNAGSFFKNPVVSAEDGERIRTRFSGIPAWPAGDGSLKLSAAWMIEHCGLKGYRDGDAGVSGRHALVLVNHGAATGLQIEALAHYVQAVVLDQFGVRLEPEPEIVKFDAD